MKRLIHFFTGHPITDCEKLGILTALCPCGKVITLWDYYF